MHTGLGDRHFSEISGKVEHRQITFKVQYDKNEPLESKVFKKIVKVNIHFLKVHLVTVNSMCKYTNVFGSTMVCFYLYLDF